MRLIITIAATGLLTGALLGGCASGDGLGLTTASLDTATPKVASKPSVDPACVTLAAKINEARAEGTPGRVAKVASAENKPRIVNIKRASLAKVAELDAMNQEFQARCSTLPTATMAAATPQNTAISSVQAATTTAATNAATSAATNAATSAAGTVAAKAQTTATKAAAGSAQSSLTAAATPTILNAATAR